MLVNFVNNSPEFRKIAEDIEKNFKSDKVYDKGKAIYDWITKNIQYDKTLPESEDLSKRSVQEALKSKKAICNGFAYLFNVLAKYNNLETNVVTGVGKNEGHAWNTLVDGDKEISVDCTFGASLPDKYFVYAPDAGFSQDHNILDKDNKLIPYTTMDDVILAN